MFTTDTLNILAEYGQEISERLRDDIRNKRVTRYGAVNATGALAFSVRYEVNDKGLTVYAAEYMEEVNRGRKPGKFPNIQDIKDWIDDKGLSYDIPIDSLAYLIARKIAKFGTVAYQQGGTDLVEDIITPAYVEEIRQDIGEAIVKEITSSIIDAYLLAA